MDTSKGIRKKPIGNRCFDLRFRYPDINLIVKSYGDVFYERKDFMFVARHSFSVFSSSSERNSCFCLNIDGEEEEDELIKNIFWGKN